MEKHLLANMSGEPSSLNLPDPCPVACRKATAFSEVTQERDEVNIKMIQEQLGVYKEPSKTQVDPVQIQDLQMTLAM